tara:strand:- start:947 stop:1354 length:408 start_codon:yes stop_codon:yes gene_type:complete
MIIGYTTGVFDLFHVGHLNILKKASSVCDKLIVGVTTDEFVMKYKNKTPIINFKDRMEIVNSIKYVDAVVPQDDHNKINAWKKYKFDLMIVGDDWFNTPKWEKYENEFSKYNVRIIYFPRTENISSTELTQLKKD